MSPSRCLPRLVEKSAAATMNTFHLEVDSWVQGECDPRWVSMYACVELEPSLTLRAHLRALRSRYKALILLTFQVNCPGCFMYALPVITSLAKVCGAAQVPVRDGGAPRSVLTSLHQPLAGL